MANNEMIAKMNRSNYNVHIVNILQLTVETEHSIVRATLKKQKLEKMEGYLPPPFK